MIAAANVRYLAASCLASCSYSALHKNNNHCPVFVM